MNNAKAIEALGALAQETRMAIFRALVREEPDGLNAGDIAKRLKIVPSTLSGHLNILKQGGLIKSRRDKTQIVYSADLNALGSLVNFLVADCCDGRVENCGDLVEVLSRSAKT